MNNIAFLGIDLAKNVFQLHGVDEQGNCVLTKRIKSRQKFKEFVAKLPTCNIGMEACGGSHYWGRLFTSFGHSIKLMHAKYVKAFVDRNKHDAADAKGCYRALCQPDIRAIPIKSPQQQALLMLEKERARLIKNRTMLMNQLKFDLAEFGLAIPQGHAALKKHIPPILEDAENDLPYLAREIFQNKMQEYYVLCERIDAYTQQIESLAKTDRTCKQLMQLPGIGPITALVWVANLQGYDFEKGRQAAAWVGLTPREHSSGNKRRLLSISKQGNRKLRCLLIHGARAVVRTAKNKDDKLSLWIQRIEAEKGYNKAVVALANKTARRAWSMMKHNRDYNPDFADDYQIVR